MMLPDLSLASRSAVEENPNIDAEVLAALLISYGKVQEVISTSPYWQHRYLGSNRPPRQFRLTTLGEVM
jgi:hypothetical protein